MKLWHLAKYFIVTLIAFSTVLSTSHPAQAIGLFFEAYIDLETVPNGELPIPNELIRGILPAIDSASGAGNGVFKRGKYAYGYKKRVAKSQVVDETVSVFIGRDLPFEVTANLPVNGREHIPIKDLRIHVNLQGYSTVIVKVPGYPRIAVRNIRVEDGKLKFEGAILESVLEQIFSTSRDIPPDPKNQCLRCTFFPKIDLGIRKQSKMEISGVQIPIAEGTAVLSDFSIDENLDLHSIVRTRLNMNTNKIALNQGGIAYDSGVASLSANFSSIADRVDVSLEKQSDAAVTLNNLNFQDNAQGIDIKTPQVQTHITKLDLVSKDGNHYPQFEFAAAVSSNPLKATINNSTIAGSFNTSSLDISVTSQNTKNRNSNIVEFVANQRVDLNNVLVSQPDRIQVQKLVLEGLSGTVGSSILVRTKGIQIEPIGWARSNWTTTFDHTVLKSTQPTVFVYDQETGQWGGTLRIDAVANRIELKHVGLTAQLTNIGLSQPVALVAELSKKPSFLISNLRCVGQVDGTGSQGSWHLGPISVDCKSAVIDSAKTKTQFDLSALRLSVPSGNVVALLNAFLPNGTTVAQKGDKLGEVPWYVFGGDVHADRGCVINLKNSLSTVRIPDHRTIFIHAVPTGHLNMTVNAGEWIKSDFKIDLMTYIGLNFVNDGGSCHRGYDVEVQITRPNASVYNYQDNIGRIPDSKGASNIEDGIKGRITELPRTAGSVIENRRYSIRKCATMLCESMHDSSLAAVLDDLDMSDFKLVTSAGQIGFVSTCKFSF